MGNKWVRKGKALLRRLDQRLPIKARCGHWARKSDLKSLYHRAAGWVSVCPACYDSENTWDKRGRR